MNELEVAQVLPDSCELPLVQLEGQPVCADERAWGLGLGLGSGLGLGFPDFAVTISLCYNGFRSCARVLLGRKTLNVSFQGSHLRSWRFRFRMELKNVWRVSRCCSLRHSASLYNVPLQFNNNGISVLYTGVCPFHHHLPAWPCSCAVTIQ